MAAKQREESIIETVLKNRRCCNCPTPEGLKGRELAVYDLNHRRIHELNDESAKDLNPVKRVLIERVR